MIVQAGFDLQVLARPYIVRDGILQPKIVLICLDAEMQLDSIEVVTNAFAGTLKPFHDAILESLDPEDAKYFAIAHPGLWSEFDYSDPILAEAKMLETAASNRGLQMIGHFGIDETGYTSAGAHSYFDQYPRHSDLPRTMNHWVHSKFGECG